MNTSSNLAATKDRLATLAHEFQHFHDTKHKSYKDLDEAQTRLSYIDKFWRILGWQVDNTSEVLIETRVGTKKPDYRFLLGKETTFFVEAKKPIEKLTNPHHIFQAKSYGWNDSVPMVILMDFEEFRPFRTRTKPHFDEPEKGLIKKFDMFFTDYADRADDLLNTFGREAILGGALKDILKPSAAERNTTVDKEFLKTLADWRERLAAHIAVRNAVRSDVELAEAVQRILDRLVFIRILEDREIEVEPLLEQLTGRGAKDIYAAFVALSKRLQPKYNGLLFNPHPLSETLTLDDNTFRPIVKELLSNESPYRFDVIPVEVLGTIYERFLGDEIRLTDSGRAKIETKPEVRKAGGVYYTPQYIVEYITQNTVGKLLQSCATPTDALRLRICDPACGSGSFLLGAFDALIRWHEEWFAAAPNPDKDWFETTATKKNTVHHRRRLAFREKREDAQSATQGAVRLTTYAKGRILQSCLYGVDLDRQATEVAQMSLYLKVLEHCAEEERVVGRLMDFKEALLPTLKNNIKCGNSLIGSDFTHDDLFGLSEKEQRKVNPFDWHFHFPFLKQTGGFDAVIGNPPYVRSQLMESNLKTYFAHNFEAASYQPDTFAFFLEQGIKKLKESGRLGFIIPSGILTNTYYSKLRQYILSNTAIQVIVDLKDGVFENASVDTSIFILCRGNLATNQQNLVSIGEFPAKIAQAVVTPANTMVQSSFLDMPDFAFNSGIDTEKLELSRKIAQASTPLESMIEIKAGMKVRKEFVAHSAIDSRYKPFLIGGNIKPYQICFEEKWVCYDKQLEDSYTNQAFRDERIFLAPQKILIRQVMGKNRIFAAFDTESYYVDQTVYVLLPIKNTLDLKCLQALISSRLMSFYFQATMADRKETFPKIKGSQIAQLPIPAIPDPKTLAALVQQMLDAQAKLRTVGSDFERGQLQQSIARLDGAIDALVYGLYGLTAEEIRIVEGA